MWLLRWQIKGVMAVHGKTHTRQGEPRERRAAREGPTQGSRPPKRIWWTRRGSWRNRERMFLLQCVKQCDTIFFTHLRGAGILCWVQWSICNGKFQSWKRLYLEIPIFHFFGGPRHMACGIIVPWPVMEPGQHW